MKTRAVKSGLIDESDIQYHMTSEGGIPPVEVPNHPRLLFMLEDELAFAMRAGITPTLVRIEEFDIISFRWGIAGVQVIIKSLNTGRSDLFSLTATIQSPFVTVVRMLQLI